MNSLLGFLRRIVCTKILISRGGFVELVLAFLSDSVLVAGDRCEEAVNECARNPCPVLKLCVPDASIQGYSCLCSEGFAGASCEIDVSKCHDETCYIPRSPVSFKGKSYAQYRIAKAFIRKALEEEMNFSLRIRTVQQTGNLMYAAGKVDYSILEVKKKRLR